MPKVHYGIKGVYVSSDFNKNDFIIPRTIYTRPTFPSGNVSINSFRLNTFLAKNK